MTRQRILITGACGQIGTVLTQKLQEKYGIDNVIASDIRQVSPNEGIYEVVNILDRERINEVIEKYQITQIYHLVAILSAKGEANPLGTWKINMDSFFNVLEVARAKNIEKIFFPSSIAVFGENAPSNDTPQESSLIPSTVYGISKVAAENWCKYYFDKYDLDIRSIRYPGIISYQSLAGGGTTDYAVDIFGEALTKQYFECFLKADSCLPMIYMDDAIRATIELMEAPKTSIKVRTSYNLAGISFTPAEIAAAIQKHIPDFKIEYKPDFRQAIADSWPDSIDDSEAQKDWNWQPEFDLDKMTTEMLTQLSKKLAIS